jgi:hypothetical protein
MLQQFGTIPFALKVGVNGDGFYNRYFLHGRFANIKANAFVVGIIALCQTKAGKNIIYHNLAVKTVV